MWRPVQENWKKDNRIWYIVTYNPHNFPINISQTWKEIHSQLNTYKHCKEEASIFGTYSHKWWQLCKSGSRMCKPCKKLCITCPHIRQSNVIATSNNVSYKSCGKFTSQSHNCIYFLICIHCDLKYIGDITQTITLRCRQHESHIRSDNRNPVSQHFNEGGHNLQDYHIHIIDQEPDKNKILCLE